MQKVAVFRQTAEKINFASNFFLNRKFSAQNCAFFARRFLGKNTFPTGQNLGDFLLTSLPPFTKP